MTGTPTTRNEEVYYEGGPARGDLILNLIFGLTLIGGMTTATVLTLLVVPIFYTFFDDLRRWVVERLAQWLRPSAPETVLQAGSSKVPSA